MAFVHLHNHTVYSMLDGATRIKDMVSRAVELGMPAVAITDHGYMYGVPELGLACDAVNHGTPEYKVWSHDKSFLEKGRRDELECPDQEFDPRGYEQHMKDLAMWDEKGNIDELKPPLVIKPIFGCEVYFTPDETLARDRKPELYHMVLFAQNEKGYVNLMQTVSEAAVQGFYYKPRVTLDNLRRHREGLIASSACIAGIIPKCIDRGEMATAIEWAETFRDTFEPGNFYIEIQEHGITTDSGITDEELSKTLIQIAEQVGVKVIATNDFHYLTREDAPVQDVVMCIGTNSKIDDPNRIRMEGSEFYMKTEEEMREALKDFPEACDTTVEVAEKVNVVLERDSILPRFPLPEGETEESYFRKRVQEGLVKHYGNPVPQEAQERADYEMGIIIQQGFPAYFLIVQEYIEWARSQGIGVGPGRGSAAGAIVAYAMDITALDPLSNGLLFERFLSPERVEMPDIDVDFEQGRREEVINHIKDVYGEDHVSQVITFGTLQAKNAVRDAARVLDYPYSTGDKITKMIGDELGITIDKALATNPDLKKAYELSLIHISADTGLTAKCTRRGKNRTVW